MTLRIPLLLIALSCCATLRAQDKPPEIMRRIIEYPESKESVYSAGLPSKMVYYYGEEKTPLTAQVIIVKYGKVFKVQQYVDGQIIYSEQYDEKGRIKSHFDYADNKIIQKSFYEEGRLHRAIEYDAEGNRTNFIQY